MIHSIINFVFDCFTAGLYTQYKLTKAPISFQDPASIAFVNIVDFHDYIMMFLVFIFLVVIWHLLWALNFRSSIFSLLFLLVYLPVSFSNFVKTLYIQFLRRNHLMVRLKSQIPVRTEDAYLVIDKYLNGSLWLKHFYSFAHKYNYFNILLTIFRFMCFSVFVYVSYINVRRDTLGMLVARNFSVRGKFLHFPLKFLFYTTQGRRMEKRLRIFYKFVYLQKLKKAVGRKWFSIRQKAFLLNTRYLTHAPLLEIVWTIFPSLILFAIAVPSLILLYQLDHIEPLSLVVKVIGHQWYWSYEIGSSVSLFSDYFASTTTTSVVFDSYMLNDVDSVLRLIEVDNALFVPVQVPLTFLITSTDVLHSWAVPSLGIKVDAIPGRLNQVGTSVLTPGVFYGQCSELCGVNHGFMPINIASYVEYFE